MLHPKILYISSTAWTQRQEKDGEDYRMIARGKEMSLVLSLVSFFFILCSMLIPKQEKTQPALIMKVNLNCFLDLQDDVQAFLHKTHWASWRRQILICPGWCDTCTSLCKQTIDSVSALALSMIGGLYLIFPWDTVTVNLLLVSQFPCHIDSWSEALSSRALQQNWVSQTWTVRRRATEVTQIVGAGGADKSRNQMSPFWSV